ncbi:hypothetical protein K7432_011273 [Basidiobolus ranarum]|uniref:Uncharacterized protein n=1 Tax=Basidiobolus ranarum TaxID=34480 RepID=A0ABR2VU68_9FUNG
MVHSSMASRLALFHLLLVTAPSLSAVAASVVTNGSDDSEGFRLSNSQWHITIDPVTLAMQAETTGKHHQTITLSLPILNSTEKVEVLSVGHEHAQWRWNSSQVAITASLSGQDFRVRFSRKTPGAIGWPLFPLNQKEGARALMFPKVEGMYIPLNDKEWRDDLINEPVSMTEGMSLPLLGVEYLCEKEKKCKGGKGTLSVIFPNPFNNMLEFSTLNGAGAKDISKNNEEMLVTAHHRFSKLDYNQ